MSTQPTSGMQGMLPGAAAAGGLRQDDDDENQTTDDGVPVGQADREADAERTGADENEDDALADPQAVLAPDAAGTVSGSDDGVPVGATDADADRRRTTDGG